jgi:hypothetical protein
VDGLCDFAIALGDRLWRQHAIATDFVVWRKAGPVADLEVPGGEDYPHRVLHAASQTARELAVVLDRLLDSDQEPTMLLHYTPYAYSSQGIAWWLPGVLRRFVHRGGRIIGFFHELYAIGRFFSKTRMSSGWQHRIYRQTLELCEAGITSNIEYLKQMERDNVAGHPLVLAGICSTIGEIDAPLPVAGRPRRLVVFGKFASRIRLYQQHLSALKQLLSHLEIEELADVGEIGPVRNELVRFGEQFGDKFHICGALPAREVGALMTGSIAGVVNYNSRLRFKSSIVGAYQAHALPVIYFTPQNESAIVESDPSCVYPSQLLAQPAGSPGLSSLLEESASAGFAFYRQHRSCESILRQILPFLRMD